MGSWSHSVRRQQKRCGRSLHRYGTASIRTQPATISCSSRCSPARCGSRGTMSPACATRCARSRGNSWLSPPLPGPKGRGYMPVLAGLAVLKGAPDMNGAMGLIDYLTRPETQIETARSVGFLPEVKAEVPPDTEPGPL